MQPINDYVVIERLDAKDLKKDMLIVIPEDAQEKQPVGKVIAVGPGRPYDHYHPNGKIRIPMTVKVGDVVIFYEGASQKIVIDDKEYYAMGETNIFLILNRKENGDDV